MTIPKKKTNAKPKTTTKTVKRNAPLTKKAPKRTAKKRAAAKK